jgi:hypothetical protein
MKELKTMVSQKINNSFISSVGYDYSKHELTIAFRSGSRFRYFSVPVAYYESMCISRSPGGYYKQEIKKKFNAIKLSSNQA